MVTLPTRLCFGWSAVDRLPLPYRGHFTGSALPPDESEQHRGPGPAVRGPDHRLSDPTLQYGDDIGRRIADYDSGLEGTLGQFLGPSHRRDQLGLDSIRQKPVRRGVYLPPERVSYGEHQHTRPADAGRTH